MSVINAQSIIVGIDVHKYSHQAVALNYQGEVLGSKQFSNSELELCKSWINSLGDSSDVVIGLEDIHGYGFHVNQFLHQTPFAIRYVPPILTSQKRCQSLHQVKTDLEDAKRVGKVILHDMEKTLPATAIVTKSQKQVRLLDLYVQERADLVTAQTACKNQLHALLHQYYGDSYQQHFSNIFSKQALLWYQTDLGKTVDDYLAEDILRRLELLSVYQKHISALQKRMTQLGKQIPEVGKLACIPGCGVLTASQILVEIGDISRFSSDSKLARYAGVAPVPKESGGKGRLHTDSRGNRRLNYAIHRMALSQIGKNGPKEAKQYHLRKQQEKHSKLWSMRCLKRHLVRRIYNTLTTG